MTRPPRGRRRSDRLGRWAGPAVLAVGPVAGIELPRPAEEFTRTAPVLADALSDELEEYVDADRLAVIVLEPGTAGG